MSSWPNPKRWAHGAGAATGCRTAAYLEAGARGTPNGTATAAVIQVRTFCRQIQDKARQDRNEQRTQVSAATSVTASASAPHCSP